MFSSDREMAAKLVREGYDNPEYQTKMGDWYYFHVDKKGFFGTERFEVRIKEGFLNPTIEKLGRV